MYDVFRPEIVATDEEDWEEEEMAPVTLSPTIGVLNWGMRRGTAWNAKLIKASASVRTFVPGIKRGTPMVEITKTTKLYGVSVRILVHPEGIVWSAGGKASFSYEEVAEFAAAIQEAIEAIKK